MISLVFGILALRKKRVKRALSTPNFGKKHKERTGPFLLAFQKLGVPLNGLQGAWDVPSQLLPLLFPISETLDVPEGETHRTVGVIPQRNYELPGESRRRSFRLEKILGRPSRESLRDLAHVPSLVLRKLRLDYMLRLKLSTFRCQY